jgi:hypothetical protein
MLYSVVVKFPDTKNYVKRFAELPISHKANGSIVTMKNDKQWNDYSGVTVDEIDELLNFIARERDAIEYVVKIWKYEKNDDT